MLPWHQLSLSRPARQDSWTLPRFGSYILVLVIMIDASLAVNDKESSDTVPSPFRVVWNVPDGKCGNMYDSDLRKSGIVANRHRVFVGDEIATLYNPGLWPYFNGNDIKQPVNGGIPQFANLAAHLEALKKTIESQISENSTGYGVIDMEIWLPFYELNWGVTKIYRYASMKKLEGVIYKYWLRKEAAKKEYDKSATEMIVQSLMVAKATRPNMHWGYYLYPRTWYYGTTISVNDRMAEIFRASTGLYPSIYLKYPDQQSREYSYSRNLGILTEALRVRAVHIRQQQAPIIAYSVINYAGLNFFNESLLDLAIGQPADMGLDGVALWGSSGLLRPSHVVACKAIRDYVRTTLGPYVSRLMERLTSCSETKCQGQGRCVKNKYAQSVPYTLGIHVEKEQEDSKVSQEDVYKDYKCQCYDGFAGMYCGKHI